MDFSTGTTLEEYLHWVLNIVNRDYEVISPTLFGKMIDNCIMTPKLIGSDDFTKYILPIFEKYRDIVESQLVTNNKFKDVQIYITSKMMALVEYRFLSGFSNCKNVVPTPPTYPIIYPPKSCLINIV